MRTTQRVFARTESELATSIPPESYRLNETDDPWPELITQDLISAIQQMPHDELAAVLAAVASRLAEPRRAPELPAHEAEDDTSLTIEEAAALLRRSTKFLYRHRSRLPFIKKIGPRSYLCSKSALLRWRDRQYG